MNLKCPLCSASYRVADDLSGKAVRCRACGERVRVPAPPATLPPPPDPAPPAPPPKAEPDLPSCYKHLYLLSPLGRYLALAGGMLSAISLLVSSGEGRVRGDGVLLGLLLVAAVTGAGYAGATLCEAALLVVADIGRTLRRAEGGRRPGG